MSATPTITMRPVTSSQIAAIGHAPELNLLAIQFPPKKSTGVADTYHYQNVDAAMFAEFMAAESQGSFFIQRIKKFPDMFPYQKLDPTAAPVATPLALIGPVPVGRDDSGWWSHPGIPDFDEGQEVEYGAWLIAQGLVTDHASLEGEDPTNAAYVSYYDDESCSVAGWNPEAPAGEGWFTLSIHDTEDGPYWVWARRVAGVGAAA